MKKITYLLLLTMTLFVFNNCTKKTTFTEQIDYVSAEFVPTILVEKGSSIDTEVHIYATKTTNSDRTFNLEVNTTQTSANTETYTVPTTVTIPANTNVGTITVSVADNNLGEDPETLVLNISADDGTLVGNDISLVILKHCAYNVNDFVGTYSGDAYFGPTQVVTSLDANGNLQITGIGVAFITGPWGEVITDMATLPMNVDPATGNFTIESAPYLTTTYNGAVQPTYYLSAEGVLNACSLTMTLYYDFYQEGFGSYVETYNQGYFTEIITISH